jgi:hypothetical protein
MSVKLDVSTFSEEQIEFIESECIFNKKVSTGYKSLEYDKVPLFRISGSDIYLPLGLWNNFLDKFPLNKSWSRISFTYNKNPYTFKTDPKKGNIEFVDPTKRKNRKTYDYRDQRSIIEEGLKMLKENNTLLLSLPCGFGKTTIACCMSQILGLKTLILCHLSTVMEQWENELKEFSDANIKRVKGKIIDSSVDIALMGIIKASKMDKEEFKNIGLVIIDEVHICSITAFNNTLLKIQPKYLIALSATPERSDGLHRNFKTYFNNSIIQRLERKEFQVFKCCTGILPEIKYVLYNGRQVPNWNTLVNSLAYNEERHRLIIDLLSKQTEKTLVLSDRVRECERIYNILYEQYCNDKLQLRPYLFTENSDLPPKDTGIIVGSMKKGGVGFDDTEIKILFLITDSKDVRQFEGRLRTLKSKVYDFVDNYSILESHWKIREKWYKNKGATIEILNNEKHTCLIREPNTKTEGTNFLKKK